jgi:hypothetical protein
MTGSRGIRNNNPGNIERGAPWQGLAEPGEMTPEQAAETRFCVFRAPEWGIRAIARILISYQDRHDIRTIEGTIRRWAPPHENDTGSYARAVAAKVGVEPDDTVDLASYAVARPLVEAIIQHENGQQPYPDALIDKGLLLAGIQPPTKPLRKDHQVQGASIAGVSGTVTVAAGIASQVAPALPVLDWFKDNLGFGLIVLGAAILAGVGYAVWARMQDRKRGLA